MKHIVIFKINYRTHADYFAKNCLDSSDEVYFAQLSTNLDDKEHDIDILKHKMAEHGLTFDNCQVHLIFATHADITRIILFKGDGAYDFSFLKIVEFLQEGKDKSYLEVVHKGEFGRLSPDRIKEILFEGGGASRAEDERAVFSRENIRVYQESAITNFVTSIAKLFKPSQPIIDLLRRDATSFDKINEKRVEPN